MQCRIQDLRRKEVINICDGCRLGYVADVDIRIPEGQVVAIVVYGPCRFFGLFGRGEEYYIPWECIQRIGRYYFNRQAFSAPGPNSGSKAAQTILRKETAQRHMPLGSLANGSNHHAKRFGVSAG